MASTYVVSDIHSCFTKFVTSVPKDTSKLIVLGDLFNKGVQQRQMFSFFMKNRHNPKFVLVRGNAEVRLHNEIIRHFLPEKTSLYYDWLGTHDGYRNKNISNVVIELIENEVYKLEDVLDFLRNCFKWYHIEETPKSKWIMSHASWELNKSPQQQNKVNLVYDIYHLLSKMKKTQPIKIPKMYESYNFIFGHTPIYHIVRNQEAPPIIFHNRFYYIDNGIFKRSRPMFYLKIA